MVTNWDTIDREHEAELKAVREKTIEQCAKVADGKPYATAETIAAAIRALLAEDDVEKPGTRPG